MTQSSARGFSLLEVMIALALFSAGLLGILQLQLLSQAQLQDSLYISRASQQAYQLSAWLNAFRAPGGSSIEQQLVQHWREMQVHLFPQGEGGLHHPVISLSWHDPYTEQQACGIQRMCMRLLLE